MTKDETLKLALEALEYRGVGSWRKKQPAITAIKEALAQPEQEPVAYLCENAVGHKYFRWKKPSSTYKPIALYTTPPPQYKEPEQEPEFVTHTVEQPYDWSEWVCPDPKSYLMMCCDCGLVHEAEFGVVRYKSETELEYCDMVDDPNLQAVFRMRRSEQWSPADTAHRAGGMPMEQPEQEPVATDWECIARVQDAKLRAMCNEAGGFEKLCEVMDKYERTTPPQRTWVGLTDDEIVLIVVECAASHQHTDIHFARAIEAKLKEKNT